MRNINDTTTYHILALATIELVCVQKLKRFISIQGNKRKCQINMKTCFAFQISSQNHETETTTRDGTKGQLISKWCLKFSKKPMKNLTNFFHFFEWSNQKNKGTFL